MVARPKSSRPGYGTKVHGDVLEATRDAVNQILETKNKVLVCSRRQRGDNYWVKRSVKGKAYIEDGAVWLDLVPMEGERSRVATRSMRWPGWKPTRKDQGT